MTTRTANDGDDGEEDEDPAEVSDVSSSQGAQAQDGVQQPASVPPTLVSTADATGAGVPLACAGALALALGGAGVFRGAGSRRPR